MFIEGWLQEREDGKKRSILQKEPARNVSFKKERRGRQKTEGHFHPLPSPADVLSVMFMDPTAKGLFGK